MIIVDNKKIKEIPSYRMSNEERFDITNQLKEAISLNKKFSKKREWDSNNYRKKYGL